MLNYLNSNNNKCYHDFNDKHFSLPVIQSGKKSKIITYSNFYLKKNQMFFYIHPKEERLCTDKTGGISNVSVHRQDVARRRDGVGSVKWR